jgi:hypothetical protein
MPSIKLSKAAITPSVKGSFAVWLPARRVRVVVVVLGSLAGVCCAAAALPAGAGVVAVVELAEEVRPLLAAPVCAEVFLFCAKL